MPRSAEIISHWHHSVEGLSTSALEFYSALENALKAKDAPNVTFERVTWNESGVLSAKREYLRVSLDRFSFDICAAPFGKDFFFSWWLSKRTPDLAALYGCITVIAIPTSVLLFISMFGFFQGIALTVVALGMVAFVARNMLGNEWNAIEDSILALPILGPFYLRFFRPVTYYSEDTRIMFEETVHRVLVEMVGGILTVNKMSVLSPEQSAAKTRSAIS